MAFVVKVERLLLVQSVDRRPDLRAKSNPPGVLTNPNFQGWPREGVNSPPPSWVMTAMKSQNLELFHRCSKEKWSTS